MLEWTLSGYDAVKFLYSLETPCARMPRSNWTGAVKQWDAKQPVSVLHVTTRAHSPLPTPTHLITGLSGQRAGCCGQLRAAASDLRF